MKTTSTKTKMMSDGRSQEDSEISVHSISLQADQEAHTRIKSAMSFGRSLSDQIDEWWLTEKQDGPVSNKYTITSTGNGNVDISGK